MSCVCVVDGVETILRLRVTRPPVLLRDRRAGAEGEDVCALIQGGQIIRESVGE